MDKFNNENYVRNVMFSYCSYFGYAPELSLDILLERGKKVFVTPNHINYEKVRTAIAQLIWESVDLNINLKRSIFDWIGHNYQSLTLTQLLELQRESETIMNFLHFAKKSTEKDKRTEIPNPLKVLEFIKNSNTPAVQQFTRKRKTLSEAPMSVN